MRRIDLTHCDLSWALLAGANLTEANLSYSNLGDANFSYAMLLSALFNDVDLRRANLRHTELTAAVFNGVRLSGADLSRAPSLGTVFARCSDLHEALGLDLLDYLNPSCIDMATLRHSLAGLGDEVLAGLGLEEVEIEALRDEPRGRGPGPDLGLGRARRFQLGEHSAEQVGGRLEMPELAPHSRQHARLEREFPGARRAGLQMLLHQPGLFGSQSSVEVVVEPAECLLAGMPVERKAHGARHWKTGFCAGFRIAIMVAP